MHATAGVGGAAERGVLFDEVGLNCYQYRLLTCSICKWPLLRTGAGICFSVAATFVGTDLPAFFR